MAAEPSNTQTCFLDLEAVDTGNSTDQETFSTAQAPSNAVIIPYSGLFLHRKMVQDSRGSPGWVEYRYSMIQGVVDMVQEHRGSPEQAEYRFSAIQTVFDTKTLDFSVLQSNE